MTVAISVLLVLACLALIVSVLLQSSNQKGLGAIAGEVTANMSKSKAATVEAKLAKITKATAAAFVVLALILWIVTPSTSSTSTSASTATATDVTTVTDVATGTDAQ